MDFVLCFISSSPALSASASVSSLHGCSPVTFPKWECDNNNTGTHANLCVLSALVHLLKPEASGERGRKASCVMASGGDTECCLGASSRLRPQHRSQPRAGAADSLQRFSVPTNTHTHTHTLTEPFSLHWLLVLLTLTKVGTGMQGYTKSCVEV